MPITEGGGGTAWTDEQRRNAGIIVKVGQEMGMSKRDITIALMTALQESTLRNLNYGDRDSLGLFQQRPSQGWGSQAQVTDPYYSSRKFYSELGKIKGRNNMALTEAAQAVQRSAYPDAYAKWENTAKALLGSSAGKITPSRARPARAVNEIQALAPDPLAQAQQQFSTQTGAGTMGAPMAPGLAASTAPITGMRSFSSADEYVATTGGGPIGQKGVNNTRKAIIERAQQVVGTPYKWGGTDLASGVDCSGFIQSVYKEMGIDLPRVSFEQANYGKRTGLKGLRPGDLVAWDNSSRNNGADHIAIYLGNGKIIEAPRAGLSVRVRKLGDNEGAWGVQLDI